jgi:LCP family protein required for cell wall assembly
MNDRHRGEESESFDWLYGTSNKGVGSGDPTELLPGRAGPKGSDDPEPTRVIKRPVPPEASGPPPSARGLPPEKPPAKRFKLPKPRRIRPVRWVLLLLVLWLVFMVAVPFFAWKSVTKVNADPGGARPADQPGTTYLLVGSDSRQGLTKKQRQALHTGGDVGKRTDTIMLLHTGSGPNLLMSIPRDSIVPVPGHGSTKINSAYAYGGPKLLVKTIEDATGIRIDDYVEIGFGGFVTMVNAVGGIEICPKTALKDPLAGLDVKAGCQSAHGRKALAYARSRHAFARGDIDRAAHQREVVAKIGSKAISPSVFLNPFRYYKLAFAGSDSFTVGDNVGPIAFARFALAMRNVSGDKGLTCGIPIADLAVHWDEARAKRLFQLVKEDRTDQIGKKLCQESGLAL